MMPIREAADAMTSRARNCLAALAAAVASSVCPAAAASASAPGVDYAGVNIQTLVFEFPQSSWPAQLDGVAAAGIRLARFDALWQAAEPNPPSGEEHRYRWWRFDPVVALMAQRGIRWLPIIDYSARWAAAGADPSSPPRSPEPFAVYAGAVAARYGEKGSFWREHPELPRLPVTDYEIWNAPNNSTHWYPSPDPAAYADLYLAARRAVRAADPEARVWIGGLAGENASSFLREMYSRRPGLRGNVDVAGLHPYGANPSQVFGWVGDLRATLDALGEVDVPIAVTELGWATSGSGAGRRIPDNVRARYFGTLTEAFGRSDCGVATVMPHTWVSAERNPFDVDDWFGIHHPDGRPSETERAYSEALRAVAGRRVQGADLPLCDRTPALTLSARRSRATIGGRTGARSGRRRGRVARRVCHVALVTLAGRPLDGAAVRFEYAEVRRSSRRPRLFARQTDRRGRAFVCRTRSRKHRPALYLVGVSSSRPDLARAAAATADLRLP
jgi:hypothetical protein